MSDLLLTHRGARGARRRARRGGSAGGGAGVGRRRRPRRRRRGAARETEYRAGRGRGRARPGRAPAAPLPQAVLPAADRGAVLVAARPPARSSSSPRRPSTPAQVVLGARPCDAAALPIVDRVMNWDYADELWNARRAATTVFSLACGVEDGSCFCSAVFLDPAAERGSDGRLTPVEGGYLVETFTDKGAAFVAALAPPSSRRPRAPPASRCARRPRAFEPPPSNVSPPTCRSITLACASGSTTTSTTPSGRASGRAATAAGSAPRSAPRATASTSSTSPRAWAGACGAATGTPARAASSPLHASGHNPRQDQNARFRQRVEHKFLVYPAKFGDVLCTGCGRCSRACPTGQDLAEILAAIAQRAATDDAETPVDDAAEATS